MICIIALVVFGVLAIFSASYRPLAKEAFDCVFRKLTLRKCQTGLDKRLKSQITGSIMRKNERTGTFIYKHFDIISTIFTILMIASLGYTLYGGYNFMLWGNCNGPNSQSFCIFDPIESSGDKLSTEQAPEFCVPPEFMTPEYLKKPANISDEPFIGKSDADVTVIEFGCYTCQYTRKAQPVIDAVIEKYKDRIKFVYIPHPILGHPNAKESVKAALCAGEQEKFWEYHDLLFANGPDNFNEYATQLSLDMAQFDSCFISNETESKVKYYLKMGKLSGVYGTPTVFINDRVLVGPQKPRVYQRLLNRELGMDPISGAVKSWV